MLIDLNKLIPNSKHFRWKEFLWLPQWQIHCFPTDIQFLNLTKKLMPGLEKARSYIGQPFIVTSGIRPHIYNQLIDGALLSAHKIGLAVDIKCPKIKSPRLRELLHPVLADFDLRMEDLDTPHVHLDAREPGPGGRYFKP